MAPKYRSKEGNAISDYRIVIDQDSNQNSEVWRYNQNYYENIRLLRPSAGKKKKLSYASSWMLIVRRQKITLLNDAKCLTWGINHLLTETCWCCYTLSKWQTPPWDSLLTGVTSMWTIHFYLAFLDHCAPGLLPCLNTAGFLAHKHKFLCDFKWLVKLKRNHLLFWNHIQTVHARISSCFQGWGKHALHQCHLVINYVLFL